MSQGIYLLRNLINGKIYVGKAKNFDDRFRRHKQSELLPHNSQSRIINAIKKYGWQAFSIEILEVCDETDELLDKEAGWIKALNATDNKIGYNILVYSTDWTGHRHSEEAKQKLSLIAKARFSKENNPMFGKKHSAESIRKMSEVKLARALRGKDSPNFGKKFTAERKQKLKDAWARRKSAQKLLTGE